MSRVKVEQGELEGAICEYEDGKYFTFKGIPYAKPPIGNLRFKAPEPPECWDGVLDATEHGPVCPQYNVRFERLETGSEDCLYLNVYTKNLTPAFPAPVVVWIHGGAFYTGSGNSGFYGPEFIIDKDVILVTFNYRLEVLGFLCLDTEEVPGNAGLKDQVAALKWVKRNIGVFGGDPCNITISGCSAGSASVSYHLLSSMSDGLYDKAICQSGVCLNEWGYCLYPLQRAKQLGKSLGKETDDMEELLQFLRQVPTMSLVNVKLPPPDTKIKDLCDSILFGPVSEKENLNIDKFITDSPPNLLKNGRLAKIPIMMGFTSSEGIESAKDFPASLQRRLNCVEFNVPRELKFLWSPAKIQEVGENVLKYYLENNDGKDAFQNVVNLTTDIVFEYNIRRFARHATQYTNCPVYVYKFNVETERNYTKKKYGIESVEGVCHTDDLPYLFNITCFNIPLTEESKEIVQKVVTLWTNFARTGNPNSLENVDQWKTFTEKEQNHFIIERDILKCVVNPDAERMQFWDDIYGELQVILVSNYSCTNEC